VFIVSIGTPLLGLRVFHGTDLLLDRTPWRVTPPGDVQASNPVVQDTVSTFMPLHAEVRRRLLDGDFPMWTALPAGGLPLGTVPDEGTFGPLNLPYRVAPLWYAPGLAKLLELGVAAGFTFLFLRRLGLGRPAAVLGGLTFAMSGFQVVWTNWPQSHVGALIPALFWAVERAIQERGLRHALPAAAVVAAMVFEGFPSVAGYALVAVVAYAVVRLAASRGMGRADRVRVGGGLVAAIVLGLALTAFQALPLAERAGRLDLDYRIQGPDSHLPPSTAATLAVPNAFGSPVDGSYFGPLNYVEIQAFAGASSLVLIAAAAAWSTARPLPRGSRSFLWAAAAVVAVLLFVGGLLLAAFQVTDLFHLNFVTRLRSVFGFLLACLAAAGLEAVADRARGAGPSVRHWVAWSGAAVVAVLGLVALWRVGEGAGRGGFVLGQAVLPVAVAAVVAIAIVLSRRVRPRGAVLAAWVVPVAFAVEALAFAVPYWPRVSRDDFYPTTPAHHLVAARLGSERLVGAGGAMYPGTTTYFGLRSLTTNNTLPQLPTWEDLIRAVDPSAFDRSPVYPGIAPRAEAAASPVLDRLAVRYFLTPPTVRAFGSRVDVAPAGGADVELSAGGAVTGAIPGGPVRAVLVDAVAASGLGGGSRLTAEVAAGGEPLGRGAQLVFPEQVPGEIQVPVTEPCLPACPDRLEVRIGMDGPGRVTLAGDGRGSVARAVVTGGDDGVRLDLVANVIGYRRLTALPRIRWASSARIVEDPAERVRLLASGAAPDEVVLTGPGPLGSGEDAELEVLEDSGDRIEVRVSAAGQGYLVVADPLQHGWEAAVDGVPTTLRDADHGVVAVLVAPGRHRVTLRPHPPGWSLGLALSAISLVTLVGLAWISRRRGAPRHPPREMLPR
jgi:Bacterial membrane protein YfhO